MPVIAALWFWFSLALQSIFVSTTAHAQTSDDPSFVTAMIHIENGEWQRAEGILKFMLSQTPELHRARLELGQTYVKMAQYEKARQQFSILLAKPEVPENVKQNIRQVLLKFSPETSVVAPEVTAKNHNLKSEGSGTNTASETHNISGNLQLSMGYDDNVRYSSADYFLEDDPYLDGFFVEFDDTMFPDQTDDFFDPAEGSFDPAEGSFYFIAPDGFVYDEEGNLLFESDGFVNVGNLDRENSFLEARLNLNHGYEFATVSGLSWHSKLALQATDNQEHASYNRLQMRLESGLTWRTSSQWKWSVMAHHRILERDGQVQIRAFGLDPEFTFFNDWGSWTLGLAWLRRDYEDSVIVTGEFESIYAGFSNTIRSISGKWSKLFWNNDLLLLIKLEYSDSNADDGFDYKGTQVTLASVYNFTADLSLLISASEFNQDYSETGEGPLDDDISSLRAKLSYSLNEATELFLAGERAIRTSDIYGGIKSDKSLLQLGIDLSF